METGLAGAGDKPNDGTRRKAILVTFFNNERTCAACSSSVGSLCGASLSLGQGMDAHRSVVYLYKGLSERTAAATSWGSRLSELPSLTT